MCMYIPIHMCTNVTVHRKSGTTWYVNIGKRSFYFLNCIRSLWIETIRLCMLAMVGTMAIKLRELLAWLLKNVFVQLIFFLTGMVIL